MRCRVLHIGRMSGLARRGRARVRVRSFFEYQKEELLRQIWRPELPKMLSKNRAKKQKRPMRASGVLRGKPKG